MKKNIIFVPIFACIFLAGMLCGFAIPKNTIVEDGEIHITSITDGAFVHSKIWIDASFPDGTYEKEVHINGTKKANYTPYLWNNIMEPAGEYHIRVHGRYHRGNEDRNASVSIVVVIPKYEVFVGDRNDFTEDHVIHVGQNVTWKDGLFNLSTSDITNGGGSYTTHALDIFGELHMENITLFGLSGGIIADITFQNPRINVRPGGILYMSDCNAPGIYLLNSAGMTAYLHNTSITQAGPGGGTIIYL